MLYRRRTRTETNIATHEHALDGKAGVGASNEEVLGGVDGRQPLEVVGVLGLHASHPPVVFRSKRNFDGWGGKGRG